MERILQEVRDNMKKALLVVREDLGTVRSGRASPALVSHLVISVYGNTQKLKLEELATIITQDVKTLVIAPFDPSIIADIEKGILEANIGFTPVVDGDIIRMSIPSLSEERRREYLKLARVKLEGGRVMVRQIRHEGMRDLKNLLEENLISEDQKKHAEKKIQEITDEMIADIDSLGEKKEAELMQL